MPSDGSPGHRQRLRERFLAGKENSGTEEALLELLLTYAIPQRDVQPLAKRLLAAFGDLHGILGAEAGALCAVEGIKAHSATLIKLVDSIRTRGGADELRQSSKILNGVEQPSLFNIFATDSAEEQADMAEPPIDQPAPEIASTAESADRQALRPRRGSGLFGKAMLKEAIEILPRLPDGDSLEESRQFLRKSLHFSSEQTRYRNANYIIERMFPDGYADRALRAFAKAYASRQELRDVCYYRFCKAEPVMLAIVDELLLPAVGSGRLTRSRIKDYVEMRATLPNSVSSYSQAIANVLTAGGIAGAERDKITVAYREILVPSFAFVVHSEFPEPGMYDIGELENNPMIRAMLWNPDRIILSLYELRNSGVIAKVSEIDRVRQFTTNLNLGQVVELLVAGSDVK